MTPHVSSQILTGAALLLTIALVLAATVVLAAQQCPTPPQAPPMPEGWRDVDRIILSIHHRVRLQDLRRKATQGDPCCPPTLLPGPRLPAFAPPPMMGIHFGGGGGGRRGGCRGGKR